MVNIDKIIIRNYTLSSLHISWTFYEVWEPLTDYSVSIYRGTTPQWNALEYTCIASGIAASSINTYEDTSVSGYQFNRWQDYYYVVVPVLINTGVNGAVPSPQKLGYKPDLTALEIIRRKNLALRSDYGGNTFKVLKRKKSGTQCTVCWDSIMQRRTGENCTICFDTGWVGGYWEPIDTQGQIGAAPRQTLVQLFGEWENSDTFVRFGNYPVISPQDIIVDGQNRRWRVVAVQPTEKGQYIITQQCRLSALSKTDITYTYYISGLMNDDA